MKTSICMLEGFMAPLRERCLMAQEEIGCIRSMILDASKRSVADERLEWLEKLLKATCIQHQDAEKRLKDLQRSGFQPNVWRV
jgi:hypothetical protein